jgi:hypothetical protein
MMDLVNFRDGFGKPLRQMKLDKPLRRMWGLTDKLGSENRHTMSGRLR